MKLENFLYSLYSNHLIFSSLSLIYFNLFNCLFIDGPKKNDSKMKIKLFMSMDFRISFDLWLPMNCNNGTIYSPYCASLKSLPIVMDISSDMCDFRIKLNIGFKTRTNDTNWYQIHTDQKPFITLFSTVYWFSIPIFSLL